MIKVLIVEDSPVIQELLFYILSSDPNIHVIGIANNGMEAIEMVKIKNPDVITMDMHMPKLDGLKATRKIMETMPTPIIIVSSTLAREEINETFQVMEAGALAVLPRPAGIGHPDFHITSAELINTIKLMSEVKVVRRWPHLSKQSVTSPNGLKQIITTTKSKSEKGIYHIVAIGASTGGPIVLQKILSLIGKDFPLPILIVQHIATGFLQGFVEWLSQTTGVPIHVAAHHELITAGNVYVAPDSYHMGVDEEYRIILSKDKPENNLRPSISFLFRSINNIYGKHAIGVLLTGMGTDGAEELKLLKENSAATIVQDEESSVVHGMAGKAIKLNGADYVLPPEKIAGVLKILADHNYSKNVTT
ncbi:MAG: chemotaxis-specific protein-glutamate methyltransferase CheB [Bacteroidota bacterium]